MNFVRTFLHAYLYLPYCYHRLTRTGAFGSNPATYIDHHQPVAGNPLKKALWKHHVKQFHESACSVATVVGVINAISEMRCAGLPPLSQLDILEKVRTAHWKERMSARGHKGRRGLPLPVLRAVVQSSLEAYNLPYATVETIQAHKNPRQADQSRSILWQRLQSFEQKGACLVIAHFDQGAYLPTLNIPHISPVGGFDPISRDVSILDVDPAQEKFYRVSFDTFYQGLASNYHHVFKPFGYGSGGCVIIKLLPGG